MDAGPVSPRELRVGTALTSMEQHLSFHNPLAHMLKTPGRSAHCSSAVQWESREDRGRAGWPGSHAMLGLAPHPVLVRRPGDLSWAICRCIRQSTPPCMSVLGLQALINKTGRCPCHPGACMLATGSLGSRLWISQRLRTFLGEGSPGKLL